MSLYLRLLRTDCQGGLNVSHDERGLAHRWRLIQPVASVELRVEGRPTILHTVLLVDLLSGSLRSICLDRFESNTLVVRLVHGVSNGLIKLMLHLLVQLDLALFEHLSCIDSIIRRASRAVLVVHHLI